MVARKPVANLIKVPIAVKFALAIAVLTVVSMAWLARTAVQTGHEQLETEINELGIHLVSSLAATMDPKWVTDASLKNDLDACLNRFMNSSGTDKVRAIVVYDATNSRNPIAAVNVYAVSRAENVEYAPAARAQVRIAEFRSDGVPVRSFSRPMFPDPSSPGASPPADDRPGSLDPIGRVDLFLSASEIEESRTSLSRTLTQISIVACLAAAVGSLLLGSLLTRPIRTLARDLRQVSQGNLQHKSSINSADELGDLARTFNVMTSNLQTAQANKLAKQAMEHELAIATGIQKRLLPSRIPRVPALDIATFYLSAKEVGGDYYDFVEIDEEHLGIVVADVSGKGVPGSLVMTMTRSLLRLATSGVSHPADTIRRVDRVLTPDMNPGMFVTLVYLVFNSRTKEIRLVRAGHNPPLLYSSRHRRVVHLKPRGIAVGLDHGDGSLFQSELEVQRFTLSSGDVFVAYTDGVVEAKSRTGADFGDERLQNIVASHHGQTAQEIVDSIIKELEQHQSSTERSDDITLVVLKAESSGG